MALVAGSFHDWLNQSSYVWGRDQTAAVLGRKKCRAHRKRTAGGEEKGSNPDRTNRDSLGKVSNRRYRRWLNDQLLRDLTLPMEATDIENLFAPPPWGEQRIVTPLERVIGGGTRGSIDMAGWEPFRNVDMDAQAKWIRHAEQQRSTQGKLPLAMEAWKGVKRTARDALRRNSHSPVLQAFEDKLLEFLSEANAMGEDKELALEAETSCHRLLLHGLTQFHGLLSRTVPVVSSDSLIVKRATPGQSVIMIKRRDSGNANSSSDKPLNLIEFLRQVQHQSEIELVS